MKKLFVKYRELILYIFFGGCTTIVSWGSYSVAVKCLGMSVFVGNILSWILATLFAFVTNKVYVFQSKGNGMSALLREFVMFVSTRLLTGGFEIVMVPLLVYWGLDQTLFGVEGMLSKVSVSIAVVILNYIVSKAIIFRRTE